jgi:hypothetical protein
MFQTGPGGCNDIPSDSAHRIQTMALPCLD